MQIFLTLFSSTLVSYLIHHLGESFFTRGGKRRIKFIFKGRQIHHSVYGVIAITVGLVLTSGYLLMILIGYGVGNIWQHKLTHNRVNEKGLVFISKMK